MDLSVFSSPYFIVNLSTLTLLRSPDPIHQGGVDFENFGLFMNFGCDRPSTSPELRRLPDFDPQRVLYTRLRSKTNRLLVRLVSERSRQEVHE